MQITKDSDIKGSESVIQNEKRITFAYSRTISDNGRSITEAATLTVPEQFEDLVVSEIFQQLRDSVGVDPENE